MRVVGILVGLLFGGVGVGLGYGAWWFAEENRGFANRAAVVTGEVVRLHESRSRNGSRSWFPEFRWTDPAGQVHEARSRNGSGLDIWQIGQRLELLTDASTTPARAEPPGLWSLFGASFILGGMSVVFCLIGFGVALRSLLS